MSDKQSFFETHPHLCRAFYGVLIAGGIVLGVTLFGNDEILDIIKWQIGYPTPTEVLP